MSNQLEMQAERLFKDIGLKFFPVGGQQIALRQFHPNAPSQDSLEFDGIILSGRTCVFVEVTTEKTGHREKIRRFLQHAKWIQTSSLAMKKRFAIFNAIARDHLKYFEDVNSWRCLYIGTSPELREKNIRPCSFPESAEELAILWDEDWSYLKVLERSIGKFAIGELFAALRLHPGQAEAKSERILKRPFITLERKLFAHKMPKAELFVTSFTAHELLTMCRVLRYQRLPMAVESDSSSNASTGYQRLLCEEKLRSIREHIRIDPKISFPNPITLVSSDCYTKDGSLHLPYRFASLDVIDGQHRLFAYAHDSIRDSIRNQANLLATILKFDKDPMTCAAQVFVTINKNQAKVKRELIVLTSYDAMRSDDAEAISGKALCLVNEDKSFALFSKFRTRPMIRAEGTMPIVTVALELAKILEANFLQSLSVDKQAHFFEQTSSTEAKFKRREERVRVGKLIMTRVCGLLKKHFKSDVISPDSNLLSPIFIASFIRLSRLLLIDEKKSWDEVECKFKSLAKKTLKISGQAIAFPRDVDGVPERKTGLKKIMEFLQANL